MDASRFVVQHHTGYGPEHWDLMLEHGDALATWALQACPGPDTPDPIPARRLPDHRKAYLDYEGPVSRGRGTVRIFDRGTYTTCARTPDCWVVELAGSVLAGRYRLQRSTGTDEWCFQRLRSDEVSGWM